MARLNQWAFRNQIINGPFVRVRNITGAFGLPPLRGEDFLTMGQTGRLFIPKLHDSRRIALEIIVRDNGTGIAPLIFGQLGALFANRAQGPLANILDSGTRTGQAECVGWTPADMSVGGLTFVGVADFQLADPWLYGPSQASTVVPTATLVFGTPVINTPDTNRTSYTLTVTGVVSGQPIIVVHRGSSAGGNSSAVSTITDTFGTPYSWTQVAAYQDALWHSDEIWIGTGGVGTSGVITVTLANTGYSSGAAIPMIGASTAAGMAAIDVHNTSFGNNSPPALSLTPTAASEGAIFAASDYTTAGSAPAGESYHFNFINNGNLATYVSEFLYPTSGVPLAPVYASYGGYWINAAAIVKGSGTAPANLTVTNPGTARAEKIILDILGPATNPTIANTTNGLSLTVITTVAAGQHLVIDTGAYTALNNSVNVIGSVVHNGDRLFMALEPGANALQASAGGATGSSLLTVTFSPPYV